MTLRRRDFLRGAALAAGSVAARGLRIPAYASPPRGAETVAIFGGGVGGLTVAHELAERGFAVTVFERRAWGGKVRSHGVPGSASGGRAPLPAEHTPHGIFGVYQNLPDTLRRIPFGSNPNGVFDNLVDVSELRFARAGEARDWVMRTGTGEPRPYSPELGFAGLLTHLPPDEAAYLADRMLVFFTGSDARRFGAWEQTTWWDFVGAAKRSSDYQKLVIDALSRHITGQPRDTSARAFGTCLEQIIYNSLGRFGSGPLIRVFDRPKNEAFVEPWVTHLESLGVELRLGHTLTGFDVVDGRIAGAALVGPQGAYSVSADHYVCALPVECARRLWSPEILEADPSLTGMQDLRLLWSNALQYYLKRPAPLAHGHIAYVDSPWALVSISEAQFWPERDLARDYGDGSARECLSVAISDFDASGIVYGRPARECTPDEIAHEVWMQMKQHLERPDEPRLDDEDLISWHIDPGLVFGPSGVAENLDPLVSNTIGSWSKRPTAATAIPNLFLAADYVRSSFPLTSTELANEAGRRAVNAILAASSSNEAPCRIYEPYRPPEWEAFKAIDEIVYKQGLPHLADPLVPQTPVVAEMRKTLTSSLGMSGLDGLGALLV